jgi:hypothetical protein
MVSINFLDSKLVQTQKITLQLDSEVLQIVRALDFSSD